MSAADYKFFTIEQLPPVAGKKTRTYAVVSRSQGVELGRIKWYGAWRQYCFSPNPETLWSDGCLADITSFLKRLRTERKTTHANS